MHWPTKRMELTFLISLRVPKSPPGRRTETLTSARMEPSSIEQSLTPNTYAKLEYRYSNYSDAKLKYPNGASTGTFGVDTDRHQVAAGVGFRF